MNKKELLKNALLNHKRAWNLWRGKYPKYEISIIGADLSYANLSGANLRGATLSGANLRGATLSKADLSETDLRKANLSDADLSEANLDFCGFPLWCGSLRTKLDQRIIVQLLYHAAIPAQNNKLELDEEITELFNSELFKNVVNKFHKVSECGKFTIIK